MNGYINCGPSRCRGGKISLYPSRFFRLDRPSEVNTDSPGLMLCQSRVLCGPEGAVVQEGTLQVCPESALHWLLLGRTLLPLAKVLAGEGHPETSSNPERGAPHWSSSQPTCSEPTLSHPASRLRCPLVTMKLPLWFPGATPKVCLKKTKTENPIANTF